MLPNHMLIGSIGNKPYCFIVTFGVMQKLVEYMFSKRSLPVLVVLLCCALFIGFRSMGTNGAKPPGKYEKILHNVGDILQEVHYSPKKINDEFSKELFHKYLSVV